MLKPYNSNTRKYPYGPKVINPSSIVNTDITGSLLGITEPEKFSISVSKKSPYSKVVINDKHDNLIYNTSSLSELTEPEKRKNSTIYKNSSGEKVINLHKMSTTHKNDILKYSSKQIEKSVTGFSSELNQLYISNSYIDDSIQQTTKDDFEVYYNGMRTPDIFNVEQSGSVVVITLNDVYLNYETLRNSELFVIGKFK